MYRFHYSCVWSSILLFGLFEIAAVGWLRLWQKDYSDGNIGDSNGSDDNHCHFDDNDNGDNADDDENEVVLQSVESSSW